MATKGRRSRRRRDDESRRISQLPKDLLQHILSFLPQKDAIQTCVLSKSWRHLGPTRPNIDLRESSDLNRDKVLFALEKALQTYQTLSIQDLHVEMSAFDSKSSSILGKLVKKNKVTTFRLALTNDMLQHFLLPGLIFRAESLKEMYLTRIKLHPIDKVHFTHLRTLHLESCYIEDEIFVDIISSCPLIEYLVLLSCQQLNTIKLNEAHSLKRFDFTPNSVTVGNRIFLKNNFPHLKSLHLRFVSFSPSSFDKLSSENDFPCLEELELDSCLVFEGEFWLSSRSIKRLIISEMFCKGFIDATNILYFKVSNSRFLPPSISLTTASKEWKSHVADNLESCDREKVSTCLLKTNELLKALSQSRISFRPSYPDSIKITDDHFVGEPVVVENLDLTRCQHCSFRSYPDMLICFFRICRPRYMIGMCSSVTIEIQLRGSGELSSRKSKIVVKERVGLGKQRCFWQQDLEEITSEVWDHNAKEWHHVRLGTLSSSTLRALSNKHEFRYRLKWRGEGLVSLS